MTDLPPPRPMSSPPPPPPPSLNPPPPPPPFVDGGRFHPHSPPPPRGAPPLRPTAGLRTAALILFWCATGGSMLAAFACLSRRQVWEGFRDGTKSFDDLEDADSLVAGTTGVLWLLVLASGIVVSIWSLRAVRNAQLSGATDVSPGLACGGWYIPLGNWVVPFVQLRRAAAARRQPTSVVSLWQGLFIAAIVLNIALSVVGDVEVVDDADELSARLTSQSVLAFVMVALLAVMAFVAMRAMRDVDGGRAGADLV